ncbi:MAG: 30S ribosomal protein S8 [Opitutaceae bacterium]
MTDPISDFLTRLRNASKAKLEECACPHSRLKESIASILKAEGYVSDFSQGVDDRHHLDLEGPDEGRRLPPPEGRGRTDLQRLVKEPAP